MARGRAGARHPARYARNMYNSRPLVGDVCHYSEETDADYPDAIWTGATASSIAGNAALFDKILPAQ